VVNDAGTGIELGACVGIIYTSMRDGVVDTYIHRFKKSAAPMLIIGCDDRQLQLHGGNYGFSDRGIED